MSFLVKAHRLNRVPLIRGGLLYQAVRHHWNKDFKPGPYPTTKEEREAAAKKYNLLPEEYEPYPDDGLGHGDYPKLPDISVDSKDPFYAWDFPEHKRNFGEPLHSQHDLICEERYDISMKPRFTKLQMVLSFLGVMAGFVGVYVFLEDYKMFRPVLVKQLPKDGVVHYTFDPKE